MLVHLDNLHHFAICSSTERFVDDLVDTYPDSDLVTTWFRVLERLGVMEESDGVWSLSEEMSKLLVGDNSYADYLGGQIRQQSWRM